MPGIFGTASKSSLANRISMKEGEIVGVGEGNDGHDSVSSRRIILGYLKYRTNQQS